MAGAVLSNTGDYVVLIAAGSLAERSGQEQVGRAAIEDAGTIDYDLEKGSTLFGRESRGEGSVTGRDSQGGRS